MSNLKDLWYNKVYAQGKVPAHYPVPAIEVRTGYQPSGINEMQNIPYIWVCSEYMLWTFWKGHGLVKEHI